MKNEKKYSLKDKAKVLFAVSSLSALLVGCSKDDINIFKELPFSTEKSNDIEPEVTVVVNELSESRAIPKQYSNVENYYKYRTKDNEDIKYYNSNNVYLLFDKDNYEVSEFIYADNYVYTLGFQTTSIELYDLTTEEMIAYDNGLGTYYNLDLYDSIRENNYQVCLNEIEDYIDDEELKAYYSLEEIRNLEPKILSELKSKNDTNAITKKRVL